MRLDSLINDVEACIKQFIGWVGRYKDDRDSTLKLQVDEEANKMKPNFKAYKLDMASRRGTRTGPGR